MMSVYIHRMKREGRDSEEEETERVEEELRQRIRGHMFPFARVVVNHKRYSYKLVFLPGPSVNPLVIKISFSFKYFISKSSYIVGSNRVIVYIKVTEKTLVV
jgi:hypothetical protein